MDISDASIDQDPNEAVDHRLKLLNAATQLQILTEKLKGTSASTKLMEDLAHSTEETTKSAAGQSSRRPAN